MFQHPFITDHLRLSTHYICRMAEKLKDAEAILKKLGIEALNPMQVSAHKAIAENSEVILLSPTGTGKTIAFMLPLLELLDPKIQEVQALILVPSRELAIQIEQVVRDMGSGFKTNAVYGGRSGHKDRSEIKHPPAILIGTPGRVADHMRNETLKTDHIKTLILDEFDKSLETGFEEEMREVVTTIHSVEKKILTSATEKVEIPDFMRITDAKRLNFLKKPEINLEIKAVVSPGINKLPTLIDLIKHIGQANGIVFCNLKDTIREVDEALTDNNISHECFYGGLEQIERERALIKFRNGTCRILLATDLAARGIDVPEMDFIIHYELPPRPDEFTHRNGRTARMKSEGTAYVIRSKMENFPIFIKNAETITLDPQEVSLTKSWETLYVSGGRKDKISKGDIAGLFFKQGKLERDELGMIELKHECTYVSVPMSKSEDLIKLLNNSRLKKKKVRISRLA